MGKWVSSRIFFEESGSGVRARSEGEGFSLVEMMVALFILTFGLLAAGQMIFVAVSSASLARTKGNISVAAQDKLEFLADLYARNPGAADLTVNTNGTFHGPDLVQVMNPASNVALNRFQITWKVSWVPDPRGKFVNAKQVEVTVEPIDNSNSVRPKAYGNMNKAAIVVGIFSPRT